MKTIYVITLSLALAYAVSLYTLGMQTREIADLLALVHSYEAASTLAHDERIAECRNWYEAQQIGK